MKLWQLLAVVLFLSVLASAEDDLTNEQTKKETARHKKKDSEDSFSTLARSRRKRQLLDGRPPLQLMRGLRGLMNGFDVVLKSARNVDVLKCIPRFVCEMTAPITEGGAGSNDDPEASTTDAEGDAAVEGEKDDESEDTGENAQDEKDKAGSHRNADPDLVRQVMQAMFQMPFALPTPFMPPPNPFLFSPFLNPAVTPAAAETEKTTTTSETTTEKVADEPPPSDENEIPRPVRHASPSQYYPPVRQVVRPNKRFSSYRSIHPVNHIRRPISQVRRPDIQVRRPDSQVSLPDSQIQAIRSPSTGSPTLIEPREFPPRSHFLQGAQLATNIIPAGTNPNRHFRGPAPIKRNDQVLLQGSRSYSTASRHRGNNPQLNPRKWKPANATSYFDGKKMRTVRRYVRVEENDGNWLTRMFRGRRRRSISVNETTIEEIKSRVRRGIKDFIENAGVTAREIMGALERMEREDEGGLGTTSSFYPGIRAGLLGYMGDPATCEEEFKDCPTSTEEVIKTYTDIRTYYPKGFTFRNRIPRPFRYLIP